MNALEERLSKSAVITICTIHGVSSFSITTTGFSTNLSRHSGQDNTFAFYTCSDKPLHELIIIKIVIITHMPQIYGLVGAY